MDPEEFSFLLDALTSSTSAERFGEILAQAPSPNPSIAPVGGMPLLAAHQSQHPDLLSPPPVVTGPALDNILPTIDCGLPVSAVTDASYLDDNPTPSSLPPIQKKRSRAKSAGSSPRKAKRENLTASAPSQYTRNLSVASDVSSFPTPHAVSPRQSRQHQRLKSEPAVNNSTSPPPTAPSATCAISLKKQVHLSPQTEPSSHPSQPPSPAAPKSHTRKCREKVTRQFENLLEVLPRPPNGVEVKHKAQILEYTIKVFRDLLLRRTSLQAEISLASKSALQQWMNATIAAYSQNMPRNVKNAPPPHAPISAILEPFVGLYCVKKGWVYGEMWLVNLETGLVSLSSCVFNTDDDDVLRRLDLFATESRTKYSAPAKITSGMVNRVMASRRPEWLNDLSSDSMVFERASNAGEHGMVVASAVPVVLPTEFCAAVLTFADVTPHTYSTADLTTLSDYTSTLGSYYHQYVSGVQAQSFGHLSNGAKKGGESLGSRGKPNSPPDCAASVVSNDQERVQDGQGLYDADQIASGVPSASETSTSFFGETEFVGVH